MQYTLRLYNVICQLYFNKAGKNKINFKKGKKGKEYKLEKKK